MKIILPGGSGQVGGILARAFVRRGDEVVVISRGGAAAAGARSVSWDGATLGAWAAEIDGADVVVNLAGRSVNCRYDARNRQEIMQSRLVTTRLVGQAIASARRPPPLWLQSSTATIYAHRYDAPNDEATGVIGGSEPDAPDTWRFSIDVATSWEREADGFDLPGTRMVKLRSAVILSPDRGGIFDTLLGLVRRGLGGTCGDGRQFVSWIHDADFVRAILWIIDRESLRGPLNVAAPNPLPNREFMRALREAWGASIGLPATAWMLEIGAALMRSETELVLKSRRVVPRILLESGFDFEYPDWPVAAENLCARWRAARRS